MKKKLFAMALCLLMAVAMAVPVFAAEPTIYRGGQGYPPPANGSVLLLASMQNGAGYMNVYTSTTNCALPGFVDSKNEEKTERNAGYLVVSHSGGGMLRQGTRKGIRRTPANRGMRAHRIVKSLDISEDVCHGLCP